MSYINQQASQLLVQIKKSKNPTKSKTVKAQKTQWVGLFLKNLGFSEPWNGDDDNNDNDK